MSLVDSDFAVLFPLGLVQQHRRYLRKTCSRCLYAAFRAVHLSETNIAAGCSRLAARFAHKSMTFSLQTLSLSTDASFHILFWSNAAGLVGFLVMLVNLHRSRSANRSHRGLKSQFVVFHVYEHVLHVLLACCVATVLILGAPGPYPTVPVWFYGAVFDGGAMPFSSTLAYWAYWAVFELSSTGFAILFIFQDLSLNTLVKTLMVATVWAMVAASVMVSQCARQFVRLFGVHRCSTSDYCFSN